MKSVVKNVVNFFVNCLKFFKFLLSILIHGELKNHVKKDKKGRISVLANGPSLKAVLPLLETESFKDSDFVVLNFFAETDVFWKIKPGHYCLADPMFYSPNHRKEQVEKLFALLEKVDWNMNLYVLARGVSDFLSFSKLSKKNINIIPVNSADYKGFPCLRNWWYKKGLACPPIGTVAILAIYVAINSGYTDIDLYGVDHTFFDSMCVDENNHLCNRDKHFYDNGVATLKPIIRNDNNQIWKISDYVFAIGVMFQAHDLVANYAEYMNVNIINCTPGSMIDSYRRNSQIS